MLRDQIIGVQFSVFSPDEIRSRSAVEITSYLTHTVGGNQEKIGGLFDPRMGVLE
jgi:DNA-directed RNA polymerase beta' subunit